MAAHGVHNPDAAGSNPATATRRQGEIDGYQRRVLMYDPLGWFEFKVPAEWPVTSIEAVVAIAKAAWYAGHSNGYKAHTDDAAAGAVVGRVTEELVPQVIKKGGLERILDKAFNLDKKKGEEDG